MDMRAGAGSNLRAHMARHVGSVAGVWGLRVMDVRAGQGLSRSWPAMGEAWQEY